MEFLVPILILLYVIASVVTAVMKAAGGGATSQKGRPSMQPTPSETEGGGIQEEQPNPQGRRVVVETTSPVGGPTMIWDDQPEEVPAQEDAETVSATQQMPSDDAQEYSWTYGTDEETIEADDLDEEFEDDWTRERPVKERRSAARMKRHPVFGTMNRRRLVEGVIWGEVLKPPRSQRPWPKR